MTEGAYNNRSISPKPNTYTVKRCSGMRKGFSMGIGRAKVDKQFLKANPKTDPNNPGPGSYLLNHTLTEQ